MFFFGTLAKCLAFCNIFTFYLDPFLTFGNIWSLSRPFWYFLHFLGPFSNFSAFWTFVFVSIFWTFLDLVVLFRHFGSFSTFWTFWTFSYFCFFTSLGILNVELFCLFGWFWSFFSLKVFKRNPFLVQLTFCTRYFVHLYWMYLSAVASKAQTVSTVTQHWMNPEQALLSSSNP